MQLTCISGARESNNCECACTFASASGAIGNTWYRVQPAANLGGSDSGRQGMGVGGGGNRSLPRHGILSSRQLPHTSIGVQYLHYCQRAFVRGLSASPNGPLSLLAVALVAGRGYYCCLLTTPACQNVSISNEKGPRNNWFTSDFYTATPPRWQS